MLDLRLFWPKSSASCETHAGAGLRAENNAALLSKTARDRQKLEREEVTGMNSKMLIAAGLVLSFVVGTMAPGLYTATSRAFNPAPESVLTANNTVRSMPAVARTRYVEPRAAAASNTTPVYPTQKERSLQREILIVGGSTGAGAAIGAVSGGKKGAAIGAMSGGVAGLIYDLATRHKK